MGHNRRTARPAAPAPVLFLLLVSILLVHLPPVHPASAQQATELLYAADFDDNMAPGWSLDVSDLGRWIADLGELIGKGPA